MAFTKRSRIILATVLVVGILGGGAIAAGVVRFDKADSVPQVSQTPTATTETTQATSPEVQAQLDYVLEYWKHYNLDEYGFIPDNDCVDFTSQSLVVRGWEMDDDWWAQGTGDDFEFSSAWVSSTAFMHYLAESGRATALTDDQRDQVKLGDVVQFDWDNSGDRDHTGVVTRIERTGDSIQIFYAGHTDDTDFRSVDWAITVNHPGASVYYWSIPE